MPARNLSDESVHDLADALRGLPNALESLNERVDAAMSAADVETKLTEARLAMERSNHEAQIAQEERHRREMDSLRKEQGQSRRRGVTAIMAFVIVGFLVLGYIARQNAHGVDILSKATGPAAQRVNADQISVILARFDCDEEQNIQQQMNATATLLGKPTVVVFAGANNCQGALQAALDKLAADEAAAGSAPPPSPTGTSPPTTARPSIGPAGKSGSAGPSTTSGPASSTTTTSTTQPPSSTTTTTTPPTPPSTTCITVGSIGVCRSPGQANGSEEVTHSRTVRTA